MKNNKKWIIIALVVMVAGVVIGAVSFSVTGFDFSKMGIMNYERKTEEIKEAFDKIYIDTDTDDVEIIRSENDKCTLEYYDSDKIAYDVLVENGTLKINNNDYRKWYEFITFFDMDKSTVLYLPKDQYDRLDIKTGTGDVNIKENIRFNDVSINGSTGHVVFNASVNNKLEMVLSTGEIEISDIMVKNMDIKTGTGEIKIRKTGCSGDAVITSTTGGLSLRDSTCGSLSTTASTGICYIWNVIVKGDIYAERSTGEISILDSDAANLCLKTTTGDVDGRLKTDKIYFTETSTGEVNVPKTMSGGKCEITTTTGNINMMSEEKGVSEGD